MCILSFLFSREYSISLIDWEVPSERGKEESSEFGRDAT